MSNHQDAIAIIKAFSGQANILTIPRQFVDYMGNLDGALFLSQVLYWSDRGRDGWFYKTYAEWQEEICLSEYEVKKAVKKLVDLGVLETQVRKANGNPTVHYRLDFDVFSESFLNFLQKRNPRNSGIESRESEESLTETTTETTTKNLGANAPGVSDKPPAANAAPMTIHLVGDFEFEACPNCAKRIPIKNIKKAAAVCPHCGTGLYIYDSDGERTHQPPAEMRAEKKRQGHTLAELPECPPTLAHFPVSAADLKSIQQLPVISIFYESANYFCQLYTKRKCAFKQVAHNALVNAQRQHTSKGLDNEFIVTANDLSRL